METQRERERERDRVREREQEKDGETERDLEGEAQNDMLQQVQTVALFSSSSEPTLPIALLYCLSLSRNLVSAVP